MASTASGTFSRYGDGTKRTLAARWSTVVLPGLAAAALVLHFLGAGRYGFFRDELYYIACGDHLAWGYIDQPPLIAFIARVSKLLFGTSLSAFRIFPALSSACLVFLAGRITREMGGSRFAQILSGIAVLFTPIYLAFGSFLSMNAFEPVLWMACVWLLLRILNGGDQRLWLVFGLVAGVGVLNKHTMLMFVFALFVGLLLTPLRRYLRSRWVWLGLLLSFVIFLPNLLWESRHGWPQIEVVRNAQELKNTPVGPFRFLWEQILFLNPVALPILLAGLLWLGVGKHGTRFRGLGWAFALVLAIVFLLHGKTYYPMPAFPMIVAAGAIAIESWLCDPRYRALKTTYAAILAVSGVVMIPLVVPVLPMDSLLAYQRLISLSDAVKMERDSEGSLHQLYADMVGWDNITSVVAEVYHRLPASDQNVCAILAGNYGEAGAIDLLGAHYGLPKAISGHNNYYLWGPRGYTGECVILFGENAEQIKTMFADVKQAATAASPLATAVERSVPVYMCRKPKKSLALLWPSLKFYL
jgi:hypothetical protein